MYENQMWGGGAWEILMWAGMIVFWAAVIVGLFLLTVNLTRRSSGGSGTPNQESTLDILDRRYARGELSKEEYERIREDLGGKRAA